MSALATSRLLLLLHLRPGLELCLRARALTAVSSWATGAASRWRQELPRRRLVSCRQAAFGAANAARGEAMPSPDEQLSHCEDSYGASLEPTENNLANEFVQLSFEEEVSDDAVCGISETVVRDVEKAAVELLAARAFTVSELRKKLRSKKYPDDAVDAVLADFKSRIVFKIPVVIINLGAKAYKTGTSPKGGARGRSRPGNKKGVPGWSPPCEPDNIWHIRSFYGSSVFSSIQTMAAGAKLAPGDSPCTSSEVASVPRVQLGCDQCHRQEAGGTTPSLSPVLCMFYDELGASAGESAGLGAGASLDEEEELSSQLALSTTVTYGATMTARRRITTRARARAIAVWVGVALVSNAHLGRNVCWLFVLFV